MTKWRKEDRMNKKRWIIASAILVILGLCLVLCMGLPKNEKKQEDDKKESQELILDEKDKSEQSEDKASKNADKASNTEEKGTTSSQTNSATSEDGQNSTGQDSDKKSNPDEVQKTPAKEEDDNWELPYIPIE